LGARLNGSRGDAKGVGTRPGRAVAHRLSVVQIEREDNAVPELIANFAKDSGTGKRLQAAHDSVDPRAVQDGRHGHITNAGIDPKSKAERLKLYQLA
jgi:hypothetical protein